MIIKNSLIKNTKFTNTSTPKDIMVFLKERFKFLLKEKKIRNDIIEAVDSSHTGHDFLTLYNFI